MPVAFLVAKVFPGSDEEFAVYELSEQNVAYASNIVEDVNGSLGPQVGRRCLRTLRVVSGEGMDRAKRLSLRRQVKKSRDEYAAQYPKFRDGNGSTEDDAHLAPVCRNCYLLREAVEESLSDLRKEAAGITPVERAIVETVRARHAAVTIQGKLDRTDFHVTTDLRATSDPLWQRLATFRRRLVEGGTYTPAEWQNLLIEIRNEAHAAGLRPSLGTVEYIAATVPEVRAGDSSQMWNDDPDGWSNVVLIECGDDGWIQPHDLLDGFGDTGIPADNHKRLSAVLWAESWMSARERQLAGVLVPTAPVQRSKPNGKGPMTLERFAGEIEGLDLTVGERAAKAYGKKYDPSTDRHWTNESRYFEEVARRMVRDDPNLPKIPNLNDAINPSETLRRLLRWAEDAQHERVKTRAVEVTPQQRHAPNRKSDTDWKVVRETLLNMQQRGERYRSLRQLAVELGCVDWRIRKAIKESPTLQAWQAETVKTKAAPKATELGAVVRDNKRQTTEAAPDDVLLNDERDAALAQLMEKHPESRAQINAMSDEDQTKMAKLWIEHRDNAEPSPLEPNKPGERARKVRQPKRV